MTEIRKLAAILAADVVGFSRLAGADEDRTLARLRALRSDLIDPTMAVHHGRVVKRTGDGILVEFRSVVDAVRCAIEVQNGMVERNAGLPPERRIEFRFGIHLGDVVEESDGDLMGDGVNIAARLEGIAQPNGICLSERPEILLITENKTVLLELGHDGKFSAKSTAWEENKVILPGEEVVIRVDGGRWFIVRRPAQGAMVGSGAPAQAATVTEEILDAPVAPQPGPLRRNRLLSESDALVADKTLSASSRALPVSCGGARVSSLGDQPWLHHATCAFARTRAHRLSSPLR